MKKVAFLFAAVVAVSFASCGNKTEKGNCCDSTNVECVDSACTEVACDSACADSCCADSCCADSCDAPAAN